MDDDDDDDEPDEPIDATMPGRCGATTNGQAAPPRPINNGHSSSGTPSPIVTSTAAAIAAAAGQLSLNQVMTCSIKLLTV